MKHLVLALLAIAACGDDGATAAPPADAAPPKIDAEPTPTVPPTPPFVVTSTAFANGAAIPTEHT
jgi:predicted small lipoprotein YifL